MSNYPTSDAELRQRVRDKTSYEDTTDELPQSQLDGIIADAKSRIELESGVTSWYTDHGVTVALVAYTCMRAKAAIENVPLASYSVGDEQVSFDDDDIDNSAQYQQWAEDIKVGLENSDEDIDGGDTSLQMKNTSSYIGHSYSSSSLHGEYD